MGNLHGFLEHNKQKASYRSVDERITNYKEFLVPLAEEQLQTQGARCMECGTPFCHALGCPVTNLIPEFNDLIYNGRWQEALDRLHRTNNFPEITGRICPAPCESACTLAINSAAVSIKDIELAIIEKGFAQGWITPQIAEKKSGKKVAVIGSGPAGLAAAQQLCRQGHAVVVFERDSNIGGILRYGIPDFKLEKSIIDRRLEQMQKEGVEFQTDVHIGEDLSARYLQKSFDAILLTVGASVPRNLSAPGRGRDGVFFAMEYLKQSNRYVAGELTYDQIISAKDKVVLVIGGGDTGSDCVGTATRQGAKKVYQFEILPKPKEWTEDWNPEWPAMPMILRTSSSHEEGCERRWGIATQGFHGRSTRVEEGSFIEVEWKKEASGKYVMKEKRGTDFSLKLDLVILAMGFVHAEQGKLVQDLNLELDTQSNIKVDDQYQTSQQGIFAAGDANTGASLIVHAIAHGRKAAESMNNYLNK